MELDQNLKKADKLRFSWDQMAQNKTRRTLLCLCIDASASMSRDDRIDEVNKGIKGFLQNMNRDILVRDGLEVCLVTFGNGAQVMCEFGPLPDVIEANRDIEPEGSLSELGEGVRTALGRLDSRMNRLNSASCSFYTPWLILISDGDATDTARCEEESEEIRQRIRAGELKVKCLGLGEEEEGIKTLQKFTIDGQVDQMDSQAIREFFPMLSRSISSASRQSIQRGELKLPDGH